MSRSRMGSCAKPKSKKTMVTTSPVTPPVSRTTANVLKCEKSIIDKKYVFLDTQGICFLCMEKCDSDSDLEESVRKENLQTSVNFCRLTSRYLGFSLDKLVEASVKKGRNCKSIYKTVEDDKPREKVGFELCEKCLTLARNFCKLHFQVEFHQMILDRCVRSITEVIGKANKKFNKTLITISEDKETVSSQQKTFTRLGGLRSAHNVRNKLYQKSLSKLSRTFPLIRLRRICKSGEWIALLKGNDSISRDNSLSKGPKVIPSDAPNSKTVIASMMGCIVSFWLVLSLSFINPEKLTPEKGKTDRLIDVRQKLLEGTEQIPVEILQTPNSVSVITTKKIKPKDTKNGDDEKTPSRKRGRKKTDNNTEPLPKTRKKKISIIPTPKNVNGVKRMKLNGSTIEKFEGASAPLPPPKDVQTKRTKKEKAQIDATGNDAKDKTKSSVKQESKRKSPLENTTIPIIQNSQCKKNSLASEHSSTEDLPKPPVIQSPPKASAIEQPLPSNSSAFVHVTPSHSNSQYQQQPKTLPVSHGQWSHDQSYQHQPYPVPPSYGPSTSSSSHHDYSHSYYNLQPPAQTPSYISSQMPSTSSYMHPTQNQPQSYTGMSSYNYNHDTPPNTVHPHPATQHSIPSQSNYNFNYNFTAYNYNTEGGPPSSWPTYDTIQTPSHEPIIPPAPAPPPPTDTPYPYPTDPGYSAYYNPSEGTKEESYNYSNYGGHGNPSQSYYYPPPPPLAQLENMKPPVQENCSTAEGNTPSPPLIHEELKHPDSVEEQPPQEQIQTGAEDGFEEGVVERGDGEDISSRTAPSSEFQALSIFPEVHWRQQQQNMQKIPCTVSGCTEQFVRQDHLDLHLKAHGTFQCTFCHLSFSKAHTLALHEKGRHGKSASGGGNVSTKCKCPRCDFTSTSQNNFLLHFLDEHLNIQVYDQSCEICKKKFLAGARNYVKRNHFKNYHDTQGKNPDSIFKCKFCSAPFLKESQLKDHFSYCGDGGRGKNGEEEYEDRPSRAASTVSSIQSIDTAITLDTAMATADRVAL